MASPIAVPVGTSPSQLWSGRAVAGISSLLLMNTDTVNTVLVGSDLTSLVVPIAANGSLSVDPSSNWYVVGAVAGIAPLVVVPNGQNNFLGITAGLGKLVIPQIESPNFITGVTGWRIAKDGSAEFNNLVVRGTFKGADFLINNNGMFFYNGTPALGNLIQSIASNPGTDQFGNTYLAGNSSYIVGGAIVQMYNGQIVIGVPANIAGTGGASAASIFSLDTTGLLTIESGTQNAADTAMIENMESAETATGGMPAHIFQGVAAFTEIASPGAWAGIVQMFANSSGEMIVRDGGDGATYAIQRKTVVTGAGGLALNAAGTTIYSSAVTARTYRVEGQMYVTVSGVNQQLSMDFTAPGNTGEFDVTITRAAALISATALSLGSLTGIGAAGSLTAGQIYIVKFSGTFISSGNGTFTVTGGATNTGDLTVNQFSSVDIMPV